MANAHRTLLNELFDTEDLFYLLSDISPAGIYVTDSNGNCLYVNDKWSDMAGLTMEEARGSGWQKGLHPDDLERIFSQWHKVVESNGKWMFEYRFIDREGKTTWVLGLAKPILDEEKNLKGYLGLNIDITERKKNADLKEKLVEELQHALSEIKTLRGIIPICAYCKKIRNDAGIWEVIEQYIINHSDASFSHGLCPACYEKEMVEIKKLES